MKSSSSSCLLNSSCSNGVWQRLWCCNMLDMSSTVSCSQGPSVSLPCSSCSSVSFFFNEPFFFGLIWAKIWLRDLLYFVFNYFLEAIIWQRTFIQGSCRFMLTTSCISSSRNNGLFWMNRKTTLCICSKYELWLNWHRKSSSKFLTCVGRVSVFWHWCFIQSPFMTILNRGSEVRHMSDIWIDIPVIWCNVPGAFSLEQCCSVGQTCS